MDLEDPGGFGGFDFVVVHRVIAMIGA